VTTSGSGSAPSPRPDEPSQPGQSGQPGPPSQTGPPPDPYAAETRDLLVWLVVVVVGILAATLFVAADVRVGVDAPPVEGVLEFTADGALLLAPLVAAAVLWPALRRAHERLSWFTLLGTAWLAGLAWIAALAAVDGSARLERSVTGPGGFAEDTSDVRADPTGFVDSYVSDLASLSESSQQRPPGPALLVAGLDAIGLNSPQALMTVFAIAGSLVIPLFALSVRALCHEPTARRLLPLVVLAPYGVWIAVSVDAVTALLVALAIAAGTYGSRPGGSPWWAGLAGVLTGVGALMSYGVAWLGLSVLAVYFVRRRPLLPIWSGIGALIPLVVMQALGFGYYEGLTASREADDTFQAERSPLVWAVLAVLLVALCCGPAIIASLRKILKTPGWPFMLGATLGIATSILLGLARGGMEWAWLPYFPWLLVAAVAPVPRTGEPTPTPLRLVAVGAVTGAVLAVSIH